MQINEMPLVRVFFSKTGRAKYTSHLDTMRTLSRAFKRSGLPVWYTMGFNPHMYMTFSLPIALGYESLCESLDVRLTKDLPFDDIAASLNKVMPEGFKVTVVNAPQKDPQVIKWADYDVRLIYKENETLTAIRKLETFLAKPDIEIIKKTKKGEKTIDIKPVSQLLEHNGEKDRINMKLRMAAGNTLNINPTLWLKAFYEWCDIFPEAVKITRTAILDENFEDFI